MAVGGDVGWLRGGRLWRVWFGWVSLGELVGFAIPAAVGALTVAAAMPWQVAALVAAGAAEGAVLGFAQSHVLRRTLPGLVTRRWVVATVLGATVAWVAGMSPVYAWPVVEALPWPLVAVGAVLAGTVLLLSIGLAQAYVLKDLLSGAGWWIVANATAWVAGLSAFMLVSTPLWQPGQTWPLVALIGVLAGAVMAATMAAVTGVAIVRLAGR
jgi:hypothetical protein